MSDGFQYRPKFVDIRVKKSGAETAEPAPSERPCDHIGCKRPGACKAPKGRDREREFWFFCQEHAAEYNKRWDYFSGMSDAELAEYQRRAEVGHRPTWTFRAGKNDRLSAAAKGLGGRKKDPFAIFSGDDASGAPKAPKRRLTRLQGLALEAMHLDADADAAQIRARYAELVKRWHPDSNGGDRGAEAQLQKVVQAYQTLKGAGLV